VPRVVNCGDPATLLRKPAPKRLGRHDAASIMTIPRSSLLRTIMLNHTYHHRGQLTVYLRQVGALVPSVYGPSADENPPAA